MYRNHADKGHIPKNKLFELNNETFWQQKPHNFNAIQNYYITFYPFSYPFNRFMYDFAFAPL